MVRAAENVPDKWNGDFVQARVRGSLSNFFGAFASRYCAAVHDNPVAIISEHSNKFERF